MRDRLTSLPRWAKRAFMLFADAIMLPVALWSAFAMRQGELVPDLSGAVWLLVAAPLVAIPVFVVLGLYRAIIRYITSKAVYSILIGVTVSTVFLLAIDLVLKIDEVPRSVFAIYWCVALIYIGGSRLLMRNYLSHLKKHELEERAPVVIYGAGQAGAQLAIALEGSTSRYPVALLDDEPALWGSLVHGVKVFMPSELPRLIKEKGVQQVVLAIPSATRARRKEILSWLESLGVHVQTMPGIEEILQGKARVDEVREVSVEDLLGRDPVPPRKELLHACIRGKSVMVTGAGGSIGSELCRQIVRLGPERLVLFELSEYALYAVERELNEIIKREGLDLELVALLGSVLHKRRLEAVMSAFNIQTIYHAAAYKHVPMVEHNMIEGMQNNVFGTWYTAESAIADGVETFVLISTDKAVRPTNVMGASKRMAELVLQGLQQHTESTRFCMVRFGNVLGSSGSVVPLFREQIRKGGPVTVTHPEVVRYFMTIPEATQLVLQAGSMGQGGDVFVLDMGEPVRISDLARRMIYLMGFQVRDSEQPNGDVAIEYTGLRPGEKLYEELLIGDNVSKTDHPMIMRAQEEALPWSEVRELLDELMQASKEFDCERVRELLQKAVQGFRPASQLVDRVWCRLLDENTKNPSRHTKTPVESCRWIASWVAPLRRCKYCDIVDESVGGVGLKPDPQ